MNQTVLKKHAQELADKIIKSKKNGNFSNLPFQHFFIDNALTKEFATQLLNNFPTLKNNLIWEKTEQTDIEIKYRSNFTSEFDIPDGLIDIFRIFNSSLILNALSKVFGIPKLMPDPYFTGGGLNVTEKGGLLDVHVDGNYHDASGLNRRVNLILYLNEGWEEGWGGEFGLYNENGSELIKKIAPLFNRVMAFDTHDKSFHGLPEPLNFPENKNRKSIILYYYTAEKRPQDQNTFEKPHSALWVKKGIKDHRGKTERPFH